MFIDEARILVKAATAATAAWPSGGRSTFRAADRAGATADAAEM